MLIFAIAFPMVFTSCDDSELDQDTPHLIAPDNLYKDKVGFESGIYGLYGLARMERSGVSYSGGGQTGKSNALAVSAMMSGTDIITSSYPRSECSFLVYWGDFLGSDQQYIRILWDWMYRTINAANTIIERAESGKHSMNENDTKYIIGEAKFFRAWAYRHLTYMFGDVPLSLKESNGANIIVDYQRTPVADVLKQMESDLKAAVAVLSPTPLNDSRIVKGTAQHYLCELYIRMGKYSDAAQTGVNLIESGNHKLVTERYGVEADKPGIPYMDMFKDGNSNWSEGNTEALWVFQSQYDVEGGKGRNIMRREFISDYQKEAGLNWTVERGGRGQDRLCATQYILNDLYEENDNRYSSHAWRKFFVVSEDDKPDLNSAYSSYEVGDTIWMKTRADYSSRQSFLVNTRKWDWTHDLKLKETYGYNDHLYLRLANTYLLVAEAYVMDGKADKAAEYINPLRTRAGVSTVSAGDITVDFILEERARELYSEAHRRYTLLRNNKWLERTKLYNIPSKDKVKEHNKLYPIPQTFIDANLGYEIKNNTGY